MMVWRTVIRLGREMRYDYEKNILSTKEEGNMDLEELLVGRKVRVSYDRHIIHYGESSDSECCTLTGTVENICNNGNFILISYIYNKDKTVLQKGFMGFGDKYVTESHKYRGEKLINTRYIIDLEILD